MTYLPQLHRILVDGAERLERDDPAAAADGRATRAAGVGRLAVAVRRLRRRRLFISVVLAVVLAGSAAAAVGVFQSQPSAPLSGGARVAPGAIAGPLGPARYSVSVTPDLNGGAARWCINERVQYPRRIPFDNVPAMRALLIDTRVFLDRAIAHQNQLRQSLGLPPITPARTGRAERMINARIDSLIAGLARPASVRRTAAFRRPYAAFLRQFVVTGFSSTATGCGSVTAPGNPFIAANDNNGGVIGAAVTSTVYLTAPQVAYVRVSPTLTLRTRGGRQLPDGYRIAVAVEQTPGSSGQPPPPKPAPVALDREGRVIRSQPSRTTPSEGAVFWHTSPPPAACEIDTTRLRGVRLFFGEVVPHIQGLPQLANRTFLSCAYTEFAYHGYGYQAAILLDAQHPGSRPATLPNATAVSRRPGALNEPAIHAGDIQHITGRRIGNAWLVVESASPLPRRLAVLNHLGACTRITGRCS